MPISQSPAGGPPVTPTTPGTGVGRPPGHSPSHSRSKSQLPPGAPPSAVSFRFPVLVALALAVARDCLWFWRDLAAPCSLATLFVDRLGLIACSALNVYLQPGRSPQRGFAPVPWPLAVGEAAMPVRISVDRCRFGLFQSPAHRLAFLLRHPRLHPPFRLPCRGSLAAREAVHRPRRCSTRTR